MKTTLIDTLRIVVLTLGMTALLAANGLASADDWQEKLLFDPPTSQLKAEQQGRIMIYDGLTDTQIARAMETQFDRVESMMFVRTIVTNEEGNVMQNSETGQVMVEDDGC